MDIYYLYLASLATKIEDEALRGEVLAKAREWFLESEWFTLLEIRKFGAKNRPRFSKEFAPNTTQWSNSAQKGVPAERRLTVHGDIDFEGLVEALGFADKDVREMTHKALRGVALSAPLRRNQGGTADPYRAGAIFCLARKYLDGEIVRDVEEWFLRTALRSNIACGEWESPWIVYAPTVIESTNGDELVDRFLAVGWSIEEVREEFTGAILHEMSRPYRLHVDFLNALRRSRCFRKDEPAIDRKLGLYRRYGHLSPLTE